MKPREITEIAIAEGYLRTAGATPWKTMTARLSAEIVGQRSSSLFMRTDPGTYGLREWKQQYAEYRSPRFKKKLFDEDIVVFPARSLSRYIPQRGVYTGQVDARRLRHECFQMKRRDAEADQNVTQLVSFFIVHFDDRFLTYKRSKRQPESRLHNYYSIGFGGHLNPDDLPSLLNIFVAGQAEAFLLRELQEELIIDWDNPPTLKYRGLLYDDSREVSRQHLGLVYDVYLKSMEFEIGERGLLIDPKFETLPALISRKHEFENWSILIIESEFTRLHAGC